MGWAVKIWQSIGPSSRMYVLCYCTFVTFCGCFVTILRGYGVMDGHTICPFSGVDWLLLYLADSMWDIGQTVWPLLPDWWTIRRWTYQNGDVLIGWIYQTVDITNSGHCSLTKCHSDKTWVDLATIHQNCMYSVHLGFVAVNIWLLRYWLVSLFGCFKHDA